MRDEILKELEKPFDLKSRRGVGNKLFQYVTSDDIVERMNRTFKGNWSTEVIKAERIEDQVLVHVRVIVTDSSDPLMPRFSHDGFASQSMARFSSGSNANQIIDVGNVYRAAKSKAIKDAVEKWGVGLRLEKDAEEELTAVFPSNIPFTAPIKAEVPNPPLSKPVSNDFMPPDFVRVVETPPAKPTAPVSTPVFVDEQVIVTSQSSTKNVPDFELPTSSTLSVDFATPVQKAAIEHIMGWSGLKFKELATKALGRETDLPESLSIIKYKEAVAMIQYGNNLNKA